MMAETDDSEVGTSTEAGEDFDYLGAFKASVIWDGKEKQLGFSVRQFVESARRVELKYKGHLNPKNGDYHFKGHLRKNLYSNPPSAHKIFTAAAQKWNGQAQDDADINPDRFMPAGLRTLVFKDWTLSPGVAYDSSSQHNLRYVMALRKNPQVLLHTPKTDLWLTAKANLDVNPRTAEVAAAGAVRMKLFKYSLTSKQDVQLSVGLDLENSSRGLVKSPYVKVAENNFTVKLQRNKWLFRYDL